MELERANAELRAELEQARIKNAEVEVCRGSLHSDYQKLEHECESLRNAAETLKREKVKAKKTTVCTITRSFMIFVLI
jgi:hypothetical protein